MLVCVLTDVITELEKLLQSLVPELGLLEFVHFLHFIPYFFGCLAVPQVQLHRFTNRLEKAPSRFSVPLLPLVQPPLLVPI
jgi:hypothetical protein